MCVCLSCSSGVSLLKINRTMMTYNQHGTFDWFEVDGATYILFKVGDSSVLLNQHYEDVTEQKREIYRVLDVALCSINSSV